MPNGEVQRNTYTPGQAPPQPSVAENGDYQLTLVDNGKGGKNVPLAGWRKNADPKKFPFKFIKFELNGTEDAVSGKPLTVRTVVSASPGGITYSILQMAYAAEYPNALEFPETDEDGKPRTPTSGATRQVCQMIDELIEYIQENGVTLNARIGQEEYKGRRQAKISNFLPPGDMAAGEPEAGAEDDSAFGGEESEDEQEAAPAKSNGRNGVAAKPASKSSKRK